MGYFTSYSLEIKPDDLSNKIIAQLRDDSEGAKYAFDDDGDCQEDIKWYDHERELKEFSSEHPNKLFILRGEGEDPGDLWIKYFKEGKVQKAIAKITFDEFDESKLL